MEQLDKLISRFKQLSPQRMELIVLTAVKLNEASLIDYNTNQMMQGKDSEGNDIEPIYRSAAYANFKLSLNPLGVVDLKVTGDFHSSIFVNADKFPIIFNAADPKAPELLEKYGREILGVDKKSLPEFVQGYVLPEVQGRIRNILQL